MLACRKVIHPMYHSISTTCISCGCACVLENEVPPVPPNLHHFPHEHKAFFPFMELADLRLITWHQFPNYHPELSSTIIVSFRCVRNLSVYIFHDIPSRQIK